MDFNQVLRHGLELAMLLPAAVYCLLPVWNHFRLKRKTVFLLSAAVILAIIFAGAFLCTAYTALSPIAMYAAFLICFPLFLRAVDLHWSKSLFCFVNATLLCTFCSLYTNFLTAPWELDSEITFSPRSSLICLGVAALLGLVLYRSLIVKLPYLFRQQRLDRIWKWLVLASSVLVLMLRWSIPMDLSTLMVGRIRSIGLVLLLLIPIMLWLLYHLFWWITLRLTYSARLQQENSLLQMEAKRYREMRSYMDNTRSMRHDFRQHLHVITELARSGETEKLNEYLSGVNDSAQESLDRYCANLAVDAIASFYSRLAASRDIRILWTLELPDPLPVDESDYCGLLGNLLDNAVHAVKDLPKEHRIITVASRMLSDSMLGVSVENPYEGSLKLDAAGMPVSSRDNHGIGLASVAATVHKYHGSMDIRTNDNIFAVSILLYPGK
ncbi:MAG: sensor histidine kinase [Oscillospiraceae bacterium]|nr:sensor histidine kinase [Oscillospiraceae bacterium]